MPLTLFDLDSNCAISQAQNNTHLGEHLHCWQTTTVNSHVYALRAVNVVARPAARKRGCAGRVCHVMGHACVSPM